MKAFVLNTLVLLFSMPVLAHHKCSLSEQSKNTKISENLDISAAPFQDKHQLEVLNRLFDKYDSNNNGMLERFELNVQGAKLSKKRFRHIRI